MEQQKSLKTGEINSPKNSEKHPFHGLVGRYPWSEKMDNLKEKIRKKNQTFYKNREFSKNSKSLNFIDFRDEINVYFKMVKITILAILGDEINVYFKMVKITILAILRGEFCILWSSRNL